MAPHLLTLPREIQDMVYAYLTTTVSYKWEWIKKIKSSSPFMRSSFGAAMVVLKRCPYQQVLLTNRQIEKEYIESDCFKKLRVSLLLPGQGRGIEKFESRFQDQKQIQRVVNLLTSRAQHILVALAHPELSVRYPEDTRYVSEVHKFLQGSLGKSKALTTIHVLFRQLWRYSLPDSRLPLITALATLSRIILSPLPLKIHGGPMLLQRGEQYRIGGANTSPLGPSRRPAPAQHTYIPPRSKAQREAKKDSSTTENMLTTMPVPRYAKANLDCFPPAKAQMLTKLSSELIQWKEKRGVEEVKKWQQSRHWEKEDGTRENQA
ncbi:hypothetical protein EK21DRAFT_114329 [Setomelanomma holmii]|uniref:Uncharacterized protein n=1 Tax=Setomelanomma holmii TaxID=210430 RepID=A0A9P4H7C1_9PLEO|nr:hypothetical protein EK21DRAFT_114329 [Setomelanomma holmii]